MKHLKSREKVCLLCFWKVTADLKITSSDLLNKIREHVIPNFNENDQRFPIGCCNSCRRKLREQSVSASTFNLTQLHQHLEQQRRVSPRCTTEGTYVFFWGGTKKMWDAEKEKLGEKRKWIGRRKRKGKKEKKKENSL